MTYKNPVFNTKSFESQTKEATADVRSMSQRNYHNYILNSYASGNSNTDRMTLDGTMGKTFILLSLVLSTAIFAFKFLGTVNSSSQAIWTIGASLVAFCVALILCVNFEQAQFWAPVYALLEGFAVGGLSLIYGMHYEGIVFNAVGLTIGVLLAMILVYASGLFRPSQKFQMGLMMAMLAVCGVYMFDIAAFTFFHYSIPMLHTTGPIGITIGTIVVSLAAFYLLSDFAMIENCVNQKAPKYMEWYCAYGLMVTIIWLYLEILRLLSKK